MWQYKNTRPMSILLPSIIMNHDHHRAWLLIAAFSRHCENMCTAINKHNCQHATFTYYLCHLRFVTKTIPSMRCEFHQSTNVKNLGILPPKLLLSKPGPVAGCQVRFARCQVRFAGCQVRFAGCKVRFAGCNRSSQVRFAGIQIALATHSVECTCLKVRTT